MRIAQIKSSAVNQRAIAFFRRDFESPQRRFRESIFDGAAFVGMIAVSAKRFVRSDQQDPRPGAFKPNDVALA